MKRLFLFLLPLAWGISYGQTAKLEPGERDTFLKALENEVHEYLVRYHPKQVDDTYTVSLIIDEYNKHHIQVSDNTPKQLRERFERFRLYEERVKAVRDYQIKDTFVLSLTVRTRHEQITKGKKDTLFYCGGCDETELAIIQTDAKEAVRPSISPSLLNKKKKHYYYLTNINLNGKRKVRAGYAGESLPDEQAKMKP